MGFFRFALLALVVILACTGTISTTTAVVCVIALLLAGWIISGVVILGSLIAVGVFSLLGAVFI